MAKRSVGRSTFDSHQKVHFCTVRRCRGSYSVAARRRSTGYITNTLLKEGGGTRPLAPTLHPTMLVGAPVPFCILIRTARRKPHKLHIEVHLRCMLRCTCGALAVYLRCTCSALAMHLRCPCGASYFASAVHLRCTNAHVRCTTCTTEGMGAAVVDGCGPRPITGPQRFAPSHRRDAL